MRPNFLLLGLVIALGLGSLADNAWAQRGRGGGGGIRGGGGGGGISRPAPSGNLSRPSMPQAQNRTPSLSRSAPPNLNNATKLNPERSPAAARPQANRLSGNPPTGARPTSNMSQSARSFQKPTSSQINDFLKLPNSGSSAANKPTANRSLAQTSGDGSNANQKTITTDRGTTITVGGKSGSGTTEGGATVGGAVGGIKIETAGGDTIVRGSGVVGGSQGDNAAIAAGSRTGVKTAEGGQAVGGSGIRAATDGQNSAVRGGQFAAGVDAQGNAAAAARGGYADSSGYRQGGAATASRNSDGYTRVNAAAGFNDNGTGQIKTGAAVIGPNGNVISAGRGAAFVNGQFVGGTAWTAVNGSYTHWGYFGPGYVNTYPNCWWPGKWAVAATAWSIVAYNVAAPYCGCSESGTYYDYGDNVTYDNGNVYYGDEAVATEEQYYEEAGQIAAAGEQSSDEEWLPLGVFAVIASPDQSQTEQVLQLALNQDGAIRGNFHDTTKDQVTPVYGSVNKETQRVALKLEGNDQLIVETGLYNLTNDECPILVHYGPDKQEQLVLIRLHQPEEGEADNKAPGSQDAAQAGGDN